MINAVLAGIVAGYGIAIPVGAVATYLITLGAAQGFRTAAGGGLGLANVDMMYAAATVLAGAVLAPIILAAGVASATWQLLLAGAGTIFGAAVAGRFVSGIF